MNCAAQAALKSAMVSRFYPSNPVRFLSSKSKALSMPPEMDTKVSQDPAGDPFQTGWVHQIGIKNNKWGIFRETRIELDMIWGDRKEKE